MIDRGGLDGVGAVMQRIGGHLRQQAFVVNDIAEAKASMRASFGCGRFFQFDSTSPWQLRGREVQCDLRLAFGRSGNTIIELMQPLQGEGIHFELLERRGPGAHHLGFFVDDIDLEVAAAADAGVPVVMESALGNARYAYLDTWESIGIYLELISDPDNAMMKMMPWWDDPVGNV